MEHKYIEIQNVREITLLGSADLAFWQREMADELAKGGLALAEKDGKAQLLVSSCDATFMGIKFQEATFSILLKEPNTAFLMKAFSSIGFFAWVERKRFRTPYSQGKVFVKIEFPSCVSIEMYDGGALDLQMALQAKSAGPQNLEGWNGVIYLPDRQRFHVKLWGSTRRFPATEKVRIRPSGEFKIFQQLIDSKFSVDEWTTREAATHGRTKTERY